MKILLAGLLVGVMACSLKASEHHSPAIWVENTDPLLQKTDVGWYYKGVLFSGYMVEKERNGRIVYQLPIIDGRENGIAKGWYSTGEKLLERPFINGKKEGIYRQWWPNGRYRYVYQYHQDRYEGKQLVFFPSGKKREEGTYVNGEPEGLQRIWNEQERLVSNYVVRNKKKYGLVTVISCIPVGH